MPTIHFDVLSALAAFGFVGAATPGPNNLMLMTSGVKFGFARTAPHLGGVVLGFAFMLLLLGLGLDVAFQRLPILLPSMRVLGTLYMLWLALRIAIGGPNGDIAGGARPLDFLAAAAFQWVNPKAWVMVLSALATYAAVTDRYADSVVVMAVLFSLINIVCAIAWTLFGSSLSRLLADPRTRRPFNLTMAGLLVASIAPILFD